MLFSKIAAASSKPLLPSLSAPTSFSYSFSFSRSLLTNSHLILDNFTLTWLFLAQHRCQLKFLRKTPSRGHCFAHCNTPAMSMKVGRRAASTVPPASTAVPVPCRRWRPCWWSPPDLARWPPWNWSSHSSPLFYLWLTDRPHLSQLQLLSRLSRALEPGMNRFPQRPLDVIDNTSSPSYSTKVNPHPRQPYAVSYSLHLHLILQFITRRRRHNSSDYEHLNQEGYHKGSAKQFSLA